MTARFWQRTVSVRNCVFAEDSGLIHLPNVREDLIAGKFPDGILEKPLFLAQ